MTKRTRNVMKTKVSTKQESTQKLTVKEVNAFKKKAIEYHELKEQESALKKRITLSEKELKEYIGENGNTTFDYDDGEKILAVENNTVASNSIDKSKFIEEVGLVDFAEVATVTQKAITDNFGTKVLNKCIIKGKAQRFSVKRIK